MTTTCKLTVLTLKPGHLEEVIQRQCFPKTTDSQVFCKQTDKIQGSTMQTLKTLKQFELT